MQGAIVGTKDGQKASQELDTKFAPRKKEFDSRQSEVAQLQDQYNKGGTVMSEDKRNQLARDIDEKKKRLERDMQDAQEELKAEQQKVLQGLGPAHDGGDREVRQRQRLHDDSGCQQPEHAGAVRFERNRYHAGHHFAVRQDIDRRSGGAYWDGGASAGHSGSANEYESGAGGWRENAGNGSLESDPFSSLDEC